MVGDAVAAGRAAVQNVTKYVLMGASSNFGNMFSMAGATSDPTVSADAADSDLAEQLDL